MNRGIDLNWRSITRSTAKGEEATGMTASIRGPEVQDIRLHIEYHVESAILYFGIGMSGNIFEELVYEVVCVLSRCSSLASDSK